MPEYNNLPEITLKYKAGNTKKVKITSSEAAVKLLKELHDSDTMEIFESVVVVFLNNAGLSIGWTKHSSGGSASAIADVKLILLTALKCGAHNIIVSHNHPSGNLKPSQSDRTFSTNLNRACNAVEMKLFDSIIITTDGSFSFADEGLI